MVRTGHVDIGYARAMHGDADCATQVRALEAHGCQKVYRDATLGQRSRRPGLDAALSGLSEGDTLVCWRLDRPSRSLRHFLDLAEELRSRRVSLVSITEGIDTAVQSGAAAAFRALLSLDRLLAASRFRPGGGAAPPPRARRRKFRSEAELAPALRLLRSGLSVGEAAARLGVARSTLYKYLPGGAAHWGRQ